MQQESTPSFFPTLCERFNSLIWLCLDSDLTRSAVFHAERYFAMDHQNHDSRHLYATALLREGQPYSALGLVNVPQDQRCTGCLEIKAKCCTAVGRHRQAREALEAALQDPSYMPSSSNSRNASTYVEAAILHCRAGREALKGNLPEKASLSFRKALALNPYLWEAFEGLCSIGSIPEVDELFPPRSAPRKRSPQGDGKIKPVTSGAGFFTPEVGGGGGNLFQNWKEPPPLFRMGATTGSRDSLISNDSVAPFDNSFQTHRPTRSHLNQPGNAQSSIPRPLSSADETGPVPKKLRSTVRQNGAGEPSRVSKLELNEPLKKPPSKSGVASKAASQAANSNAATRRSTRLLGGPGPKPPSKSSQARDRRRQPQPRNRSIESDLDEELMAVNELTHTPSPHSNTQSVSEGSPSTLNWIPANEQAIQEQYEAQLAEHYLYNLTRRFASATRSLATYNCQNCLDELANLPRAHQNSSWVLAMVGRAHYEKLNYSAAERAFKAVRRLEPHRLWDMEIYSTLLWHLQRNVELSFLAQELLNISPRSSQAWIAIGNLFSLQKEKSQALTCFRRAAQLEPSCAYAYTLSGHESIDEDLDKAITFFQTALRADPRHYNAWYGLGTCYLRMSKIRLAEYHYRKALEIHPNNAVLLGCVGMTVERRGDRDAALILFDKAVSIEPANALVRYRRAKILISMRKYDLALRDLEELRNKAPEESNVIFQLARVYRLLGDELKSEQMLAFARDISPKSLNKIKKLLDTLKDELVDDKMDEG